MNWRNMMYGFILVALTLTLNACDGGGGDDSASGGLPPAALTGVNTGIAVDPYIVNAQFEEVSADGKTLLQRSSSFTDVQGRFSFPQPITENSIIRLKASSKGMHGDAPYAGVLKRKVSIADDGTIVVSPLTTLVANGMTDAEVTRLMADAGLPGLDTAAIYTDPLENLMERSAGVNDAMLVNLQANMAANNFMEATGNFNYRGEATGLQMADMVASVEHSLNADLFNQLSAQIGADFTLGDLVNTAVQLNRTIVSQVREEVNGSGSLSTQRVEEITVAAVADIDQVAMEVTQNRTGLTIEPTPDPVPTPTPDPVVPVTGEDLYVTECQGCHGSLQTTNISNRTATGIQAAIAGNAGGMGSLLLSADEVQRIADALPVPSPPPVEPPQYRNGQAVYDQECAGCHILSTHDDVGNIDLAGLGSVLTGKIEAGHMGKTLPTQELSALADFADTFTPPAPPVVPRSSQTVYDENCAGCHKLNGYDAVGNIDLAGMGNTALTKIPTGHGGSLSTEELTNLAAWLDSWAPVPPPVVARDGQVVYDDNCAGCHKIYGYDANGNIDLASMGSTAATKLATGHGGTVSAEEVSNLTAWLDTWTPEPPPVVDRSGETIYNDNCAVCHKLYGYDAAGSIDLASQGDLVSTKLATGHGGSVTAGEVTNIANWLNTWAPEPPPVIARSGETVYNENCATCHKLYGYDANGNIDLASMGNTAITKLATGHGGTVSDEEVTNIADWLDSWAPAPPPVVDRTGQVVYDDNCAGCHKLYGYDDVGNIDLASMGSTAITKLGTGHGGTVTAGEVTNVADWLDTWAPAPPPVVDRTGQVVYDDNCAGCHKVYGYDADGNIDLASMGSTAITKLGTGHGGTVTTGEIANVANWLDTWAPAPPPVVTRNGETVYNDNCSGCHKINGYDANGNIDLAGQGDLVPGKLGTGHGGTVTAAEQTNLVNWLNTFQASDPYAGACDSCHGQPPAGSSFPDTAGAHGVHTALNGLINNCAACHTDAAHNDQVDLLVEATWDAKSGVAVANNDGTCSNISCHGGQTTPNWIGGSINVDTQCTSCHSSGTSQYNGYSSGEHSRHTRRYSCTACHDPARLQNGHFGNLATRTFEQAPSATIKSSLSYANGRCATPSCHGGESW